MGEVIFLGGITSLDIPADRVLEQALGKLDKVVLTGFDKAGDYYFASSCADGGDVLWLLRKCEQKLLEFTGEE